MLVARVAMRLGADRQQSLEMMNVDMDKDTKEAGQDLLAGRQERFGEGHIGLGGKEWLVVDLRLDPVHQQADVLVRRQRHRLLVGDAIRPQVFELWPARHARTSLVGAVIGDDAIDQIDSIEKVHHMHSYPIAMILA